MEYNGRANDGEFTQGARQKTGRALFPFVEKIPCTKQLSVCLSACKWLRSCRALHVPPPRTLKIYLAMQHSPLPGVIHKLLLPTVSAARSYTSAFRLACTTLVVSVLRVGTQTLQASSKLPGTVAADGLLA